MLISFATIALITLQQAPQVGELIHINTRAPLYLVEGSVTRDDGLTLATFIKPLDDHGLMSMRLEIDCSARRYRPNFVSFYTRDGSVRRSGEMSMGLSPESGWSPQNADGVAESVCS